MALIRARVNTRVHRHSHVLFLFLCGCWPVVSVEVLVCFRHKQIALCFFGNGMPWLIREASGEIISGQIY